MNDVETRLTELLKAGVGDPPNRVSVQAVRRKRAKRQMVTAAGAAAAIAALAAVSVGLAGRVGSPGAAAGAGLPAGVPRFYVEEGTSSGGLKTVVRSTATGLATARVGCPWRDANSTIYPIAADGHQRFFMICTARRHQSPTGARIYQFRVTGTGQVRDYSLIPGGQLGAVIAGPMAVSPTGSHVAVIVSPPGTGPATTPQAQIIVINTRTGAHAVWRNAQATRHAARFRIFDISFASGGRELAFLGTRTCGPQDDPPLCQPRDQQIRALSPAAKGGVLSTGPVLLRTTEPGKARWIEDAAVSADGSTLTIVTTTVPPKPQPSTVTVSQVKIGTGKHRVIYRIHGSSGQEPEIFFTADATGRHFLISAGPFTHPAVGWIHHGQLVSLKPFGAWVFYEAW